MEMITIPRPLYDMMVEQTKRNAATLTRLLNMVNSADRVTIAHVALYRTLTGTDLFHAKRELEDWRTSVRAR